MERQKGKMKMKCLFIPFTLAYLALFMYAAHARTFEVHDAWMMKCEPSNSEPFVVAISDSRHILTIGSRNGKLRDNTIVKSVTAGQGFKIIAMGSDRGGNSRMIEAFFSASGGYLNVLDRDEPAIPCDADTALSND